MPSISDPLLEQVNYLTQSLYHQQSHRHVTASVSTNSELMAALQSGKLSPSHVHLLTADSQSAGRGQNGRRWQSPKGNVYLSLYYPVHHRLYPLSKPISGLLSLCVGYYLSQLPIITTVNQARQQNKQPMIGVKWANDIGFYQSSPLSDAFSQPQFDFQCESQFESRSKPKYQFQKLAGILIEPLTDNGQLLGVVVGVGLNVQSAPLLTRQTQEGMSYQSVSLADLVENKHTLPKVDELYQPISQAIFQALLTHQLLAGSEAQLANFLESFANVDKLRHRQLQVTQDSNQQATHGNKQSAPPILATSATQPIHIVTGKAVGIDKHGCLQIQADDGKVSNLFTGKIDVIG